MTCLQQALNARGAPGVTDLVLNPDAHAGYGAPVGCVLTSPTHVYPGPVGVDIKCSMSFLQLDLPADQLADKTVRRALIDAILERTPTGYPIAGRRSRTGLCAPLGTPEANAYLDDLALGTNFATVNHLLINALVLDAFEEVIPGVKGSLMYFISHNIARKESLPDGHGGFAGEGWVHRKGAIRAFPAGHPSLKDTPFAETGHPILLPGNPCTDSVIMVAEPGAEKSAYSVNHGAGRAMGHKAADRALDQRTLDDEFVAQDILTNCRLYPKDEAPAAYKDFNAVLD